MTLSIPPTGQPVKENPRNPWEQDFNEMNNTPGTDDSAQEEGEFIAEGQINRPAHRNPFYNFPLILVGTLGAFGIVGYMFFGNFMSSQEAPKVAKSPTSGSTLDNTDQQKLAESQAKLAMGGSQKAFESHNKPASPTPGASPSATSSPTTIKPTTPPAVTKASPSVTKTSPPIVYRTMQPVAKASATPQPSPQSFIPLGNGQAVPRQRAVATSPAPVATASKVVRPPKVPLASEQFLLVQGAYKPAAQLISGATVPGRLSSAMQSSGQGNNAPNMLRVVLDRPLSTNKGLIIPSGATIAFNANVNPQNGAVTAESLDGEYLGKKILIPKGSIALQAANNQPLIATEFKPRMGDLATADRNNAFWGAAGEVGNELTKGQTSINVGSGSTIIQQANNSPNIPGALLKGAAQNYANDQRQRTQQEATKIMAGQPVQFLAAGTPVSLTVINPAMVRIPL
jgi:cytoskeletal protein RodZ